MERINGIEKRYFENLFDMGSGYVLDYSDRTFGDFFATYNIDIHGKKYQIYGTSKAKKLRAFWDQEPNHLVGKVLSGMLASYEAFCILNKNDFDEPVVIKARDAVARLLNTPTSKTKEQPINEFLERKNEFLKLKTSFPNINNLPITAPLMPIIQSRLNEAQKTLDSGSYLSVIFLCGSILEGVLLGAAQKEPARFNQAQASPKNNDKVKPLHDWKLVDLIEVACELGLLKPDVKDFSHGLRSFRNYIHPYQQVLHNFEPDKHTAELCFQVLKLALVSIAGKR